MPAAHRLPILASLLVVGCSEPDVPSAQQADNRMDNLVSADDEIAAPSVPKGGANAGVRRSPVEPVGPHGQHDPHGALDPERLVKVALQHDREGRRELALRTLAEGIAKYPQAARLYAVRASIRLQMQQVSAALKDLERAVMPDDASVRVNRAQAYRAFGRYNEAMADLDKAVAISPDLIAARFNRGALTSSTEFGTLLDEAELVFESPANYVDIAPGRTPMLDYERAIRSPEGDVEVRFAIRPPERLQIDDDDPHGATPDPNHIFPLVFESLASRLAGGRHAPSNEYAPEDARAIFNADWTAAAVFDTVTAFDTEFRQGLLVAIHRNKVADAYAVVLFDDYAEAKPQINATIRTLRFLPYE